MPAVAGTLGANHGNVKAEHAWTGQFVPAVAGCLQERDAKGSDSDTKPGHLVPVEFDWQSGGDSRGLDPKATAQLQRCQTPAVSVPGMQVRRLTPVECERLQGFPDNFTRIPWRNKAADQCPDGPRYKAIGNSMAVNCMEWIGRRIQACEH